VCVCVLSVGLGACLCVHVGRQKIVLLEGGGKISMLVCGGLGATPSVLCELLLPLPTNCCGGAIVYCRLQVHCEPHPCGGKVLVRTLCVCQWVSVTTPAGSSSPLKAKAIEIVATSYPIRCNSYFSLIQVSCGIVLNNVNLQTSSGVA